MALDPKVREAIEESVQAEDLGDQVTKKLVRWFEDLADGKESIDNKEQVYRRLGVIFKAIEESMDSGAKEQGS